jgi:predicted porin
MKSTQNNTAMLVLSALLLTPSLTKANELELYGLAHVSLDNNDDGIDSSFYVASNSSRFGLKGNLELESGHKIIYQFESGVDLSGRGNNDGNGGAGSNSLFTKARDSFVGIDFGWGNIKAGRLGVLNQWLYDFNLFADQVGDLGNFWGATGIPGRADGTVMFELTPSGNLSGHLLWVPENGVDNSTITSFKGKWQQENLHLAIDFINKETPLETHSAMSLTAQYQMDQFVFGASLMNETDIAGVSGNDRDTFSLGASYAFDGGQFKIQYATSDSDLEAFDGTQIALGADFALDKSTTFYIAYSQTDNDPLSSFTTNNYGHGQAVTVVSGQDPSSFSIGLVYHFSKSL